MWIRARVDKICVPGTDSRHQITARDRLPSSSSATTEPSPNRSTSLGGGSGSGVVVAIGTAVAGTLAAGRLDRYGPRCRIG